MFQKGSFSAPSDTSGIFLSKVIQTRRCSWRKHAKTGKFLRIVVKKTKPRLISKRKKKMKAITIRSSHFFLRKDFMTFKFQKNALILLKKNINAFAREVIGPSSKELKMKRYKKFLLYIY